MAKCMIDEYAYELKSVGGEVSRALSECNYWQDDVKRSYENYTSDINSALSSLSFFCDRASSAVSNAASVDINKYKSELDELINRVRSI